jgi:dehydrogenase/reductase SDR family member 7B
MSAYWKNKTVWITGAGSGIGQALALELSKRGANLILSARSEDKLQAVKNKCTQPDKAFVLPFDLADIPSFGTQTERAIAFNGKIDVLINNGGISQRGAAHETPIEIDRRIMEVNYFGNIALTKALLPHFRTNGSGQIAVVSSISGKFGFFLRSAYAASKHALQGFYESLRLEESPNGLKVNMIYPGIINTPISLNALTASGEAHGQMDEKQAGGISAERCAQQILAGMEKNRPEIFAGGKELLAVKIKRLFPRYFFKMIAKQKAT